MKSIASGKERVIALVGPCIESMDTNQSSPDKHTKAGESSALKSVEFNEDEGQFLVYRYFYYGKPSTTAAAASTAAEADDDEEETYGASKREGYWDNVKMQHHIVEMMDILEYKYPKEAGYAIEFSFDWSTGHSAYAPDALLASKLNLNFGERADKKKKLVIQSTTTIQEDYPLMKTGQVQNLFFQEGDAGPFNKPSATHYVGQPKGVRQLLFERGLLTRSGYLIDPQDHSKKAKARKKSNDERETLGKCKDFSSVKPAIALLIEKRGHICDFSPKFHCELSPIEYIWGGSKQAVRGYCDFTFRGLMRNIQRSFTYSSMPRTLIFKYFRLARRYMSAYRNGCDAVQAVQQVKKYKSHRAILTSDVRSGGSGKRNSPWSLKKKLTQ